jgi:hypothetical protein
MRVDVDLCTTSLARKQKSLLRESVGCNTPHLLPPAHPRCQGPLLTQHCYESSKNFSHPILTGADSIERRYTLLEADHRRWRRPPTPFILRIKQAVVNICGHVNLDCGFLQTNANCRAPGDYAYARAFHAHCPHNHRLFASSALLPTSPSWTSATYGAVNCSQDEPYRLTRLRRVKRVFVVSQVDDTHIYHTHLEITPRIIYFLDLFHQYPDLYLLYGCDRMKVKEKMDPSGTQRILNAGKYNLIRILTVAEPSIDWAARVLIQEHVQADEIYLPMEGGCQDVIYNTWLALYQRQFLLQRLGLLLENTAAAAAAGRQQQGSTMGSRPAFHLSRTIALHQQHEQTTTASSVHNQTTRRFGPWYQAPLPSLLHDHKQELLLREASSSSLPGPRRKPVLTLVKRSANSQFTRNSADLVRAWTDAFTTEVIDALQQQLPQYEIRLFSDRNVSLLSCFACQVQWMYETDVLVAVHGAGLGMALYMPPTSVMIEIAPYTNDGRLMLGGGPFSRVAALMSQHYYAHYIAYPEFVWESRTKTSRFNVTRLVTATRDFLQLIDHL